METVSLRGRRVAGFGVRALERAGVGHPDPAGPSAWKFAVVTSAVGAATGWVLEEVARRTFRRRR